MKFINLIAISFLLVLTSNYHALNAQTKKDTQESIRKIDVLIQSLIADKKSAGFMLGIQVKRAVPVLKEYGVADVQTNQAVGPDNIFRIASVTKPITAVAIMSLIEKGKLNLNDKLSKFFKDYPNGDKITVYQLLSHTSGIPNWWEGEMPSDTPKDFPMCKQPHLYLQKMKNTSFFEPGTKHYYSNSGYVLLGEIIEIASGMSYEDYLKKQVFKKAGMRSTMIENDQNTSANWVKGYVQKNAADKAFSNPDVYAMPFAAGALRSNAKDMLLFLNALYDGKLVKKSSLENMAKYAVTNSGVPVYDAMYFPKGFTPPNPPAHLKKYGYGLGFNLMEIYDTPVVWHSGGIAGFNAILMYVPKTQTKIILLSNTENGIIPIWEELQKIIVTLN